MLDLGFLLSTSDPSLFVRKGHRCTTYVLLYVYDIIINGSNFTLIPHLMSQLGLHFKMKDLGQLIYFLGVEVQLNKIGLFLSQVKDIIDLLLKPDMVSCKPIGSPASKSKLSPFVAFLLKSKLSTFDASPLQDPFAY